MTNTNYYKIAGLTGVVSAICIVIGAGMLATTLPGGPDSFGDPNAVFATGSQASLGLRRALTFGMFGFYILLAPLVLAVRELTRERGGTWTDMFAIGGFGYALVGAIGAAVALTVLPLLIESYETATEAQRIALASTYVGFQSGVFEGLWNVLEKIPGGVFWLGTGILVWPARRYFAGLSILLGAATLLAGFAWNLGLTDLAAPLDMLYLILSAVWPAWLGVILFRHGEEVFTQQNI